MGGSAVVSFSTLVASGALFSSIQFCSEHPEFFAHAMSLSAAAVFGQWCIYSQVKEFGALIFAMTMNLRQVLSILVSYVMYGHSITLLQILGLCSVFGALFYKSASGVGHHGKESNGHSAPKPAKNDENDEEALELAKQPEPQKLGTDKV